MAKDLDIFILKNENSVSDLNINRLVSISDKVKSVHEPCLDSIKRQVRELEINAEVQLIEAGEVPRDVDSRLVIILDQNALIPRQYLLSAVSMNNMYKSKAVFCGPVSTKSSSKPNDWFIAEVAEHYKTYTLNEFNKVLAFDITEEPNLFPPATSCVISGRFYNEVGGYTTLVSPRGDIKNNSMFLLELSKIGSIIYTKSLETSYYVSPAEFEISNFSKFFYQLGYSRGVNMFKSKEDQYETLWKMFVESPESIDNRTLSFINFNTEIDADHKKKYAEKLATFKCLYQIGMFEGINGQKIL